MSRRLHDFNCYWNKILVSLHCPDHDNIHPFPRLRVLCQPDISVAAMILPLGRTLKVAGVCSQTVTRMVYEHCESLLYKDSNETVYCVTYNLLDGSL